MIRPALVSSFGLLVVAGCGGSSPPAHQDAASDAPSTNPQVLWLAPDMAETAVKLTETEPPPF